MISIVDDDEVRSRVNKGAAKVAWLRCPDVASVEEFLNSNLDDTSCLILDVQLKGLRGIELQERLIREGR